jgi:5-guanidino-2-oxopentanoate decarboxylase
MSVRRCGEEVVHILAAQGVQVVFGMPGVHSLPFYTALEEAGIRHVGVRHEQGAGFMADGYARAARRPGVALLISGPGVTNVATALGQAWSDSIPVLVVSAAIATRDQGMDAGHLHEIADQRAVTAPLTALSLMINGPEQIAPQLARVFARMTTDRPRPNHVSIPLDVLDAEAAGLSAPSIRPTRPGPDPEAVSVLAALLEEAHRPVIVAGGGAVDATSSVRRLVERTGALFVSTVAGKGILPDSHPLSGGATLQRPATRRALAEADLVLAIGSEIAEPDLYVTADAEAGGEVDPALLEPRLKLGGRFARIDIDSDVLVRDYDPVVALRADARLAVDALLSSLNPAKRPSEAAAAIAATLKANGARGTTPLEKAHQVVLAALRAGLPDDALVYSDMTQIGYTGCIIFPVEQPGCFHFPMGFGTLGYALPAAIGGQIACPDRAVAAMVGDGGFQFTLQELATAVQLRLPIPILLWDNDALGEIADFMRARGIPQIDVHPENPDFADVARAYRCGYTRPERPAELTQAVEAALSADGPTLIHVRQALDWRRFES